MKLFLLLTDTVILAAYGAYALHVFQGFETILVLLLFFFAARVLALSVHPVFTAINLGLLCFLWPYHPEILALSYLFYAALYVFLARREEHRLTLTRENTQLKVSQKNHLRYLFLKENYDSQMALNLRLEERRAIAQQIHDLLGHSMTAAILQLEAAEELLDDDPRRARSFLNNATNMMRQGIDQVREAVHQMRADVPTLKAAEMRAMIDRFRLDSGIVTVFDEEGTLDDLPVGIWQVILGNLREGLTNIIRHAGATQVDIRLQALPGVVRLEVRDNGRGCENLVEGMGIGGMRERATEYGGSLLVQNDQGMRVITLIPRREVHDDTGGGH
ncbi:MAG: sensor histidine kinase [Candidatus Excrementavichristensenella sp.]